MIRRSEPELLHVGTDEAGYGPLLGPLVVAAAAYVRRGPRAGLRHAGVEDSKVAYGRGGRAGLARVLGAYWDLPPPVRLSDLLRRFAVGGDERERLPWYGDVRDADARRRHPPPPSFRRIFLSPVLEDAFNRDCDGPGGKATLLFRETMRVVRAALASEPDLDAVVVCDKHGGRNRYAPLLLQELRPRTLATGREGADLSEYRLTLGSRSVRMLFRPRADATDGPVALASMAAKYVRELFMEGFNRYFAERVEGLAPTAGYYGDGRRFLREIQPALAEMGVAPEALLRRR